MFNARRSALDRLFSKFDDDEGEMIKKHSPKAVEIDATVAKPEGDGESASGIPAELIAKLVAALKDASPEASSDEEPLKLAHGGQVEANEPTGMGNRKCRGCGRDASMCVCDKMSDGGLVEGDSLADEQMKRREEVRKLEQDRDAGHDMAELAGEEPEVKVASRDPRKLSEGGLIEGDSLQDEQMKRREENRKAEQDHDAESDMEDLAGGRKPRWKSTEARKSRYYKG